MTQLVKDYFGLKKRKPAFDIGQEERRLKVLALGYLRQPEVTARIKTVLTATSLFVVFDVMRIFRLVFQRNRVMQHELILERCGGAQLETLVEKDVALRA